MATQPPATAQTFKLRASLLSEGRTNDELAATDLLWLRLKVYAQGGENVLHQHHDEDHAFVILEGQATFHDKDDRLTVVNKNEGIMLPKGTPYWFQSSGDSNLVLLRVGASETKGNDDDDRLDINGNPLPGISAANKHVVGVPIPGKFFGG
jgi:mannose-6-phosphate isomerase-like protein (cupin superfamily)